MSHVTLWIYGSIQYKVDSKKLMLCNTEQDVFIITSFLEMKYE